jgi:hypothetical protein
MNIKAARISQPAKPAMKKSQQAIGFVAALGEHSIAFGMRWDRISAGKVARSTVSNAAAKYAASSYVLLPARDGKRSIGLLANSVFVEKGASKKKAISAAALLASAYPGIDNAVFGVALPGGKVAFMGFRSGSPLIGFDRVTTLELLPEVTADFLKEFDDQAAPTVKFHAADGLFIGRNADEFYGEWFTALPKKTLVAASVRRAQAPTKLIVAAVMVIAASYGAFITYEQHQEDLKKQAPPAAQDPQVLYEKSANEYLSAAVAGSQTAGPMTAKINRLPMYHQGWKLEKATCAAETCTLSWNNSDGGTYRSFAASPLPGLPDSQTTYKEGMTGIESTFAIVSEGPKGFRMDELPKQEQFVMFFGSKAQEMKGAGLEISLAQGAVVAMPPTPAGTPTITEEVLKEKVVEGTWTMTGNWAFYQALASLPGNMTVELVEVGVADDSMSMSVTGKYYVKK